MNQGCSPVMELIFSDLKVIACWLLCSVSFRCGWFNGGSATSKTLLFAPVYFWQIIGSNTYCHQNRLTAKLLKIRKTPNNIKPSAHFAGQFAVIQLRTNHQLQLNTCFILHAAWFRYLWLNSRVEPTPEFALYCNYFNYCIWFRKVSRNSSQTNRRV